MSTDPVQCDCYTPSPVSSDNYEPDSDPDSSDNNGISDSNDDSSDNDESSEIVSSEQNKEEEEEIGINKEDAKKKAQIFISLRQISGFKMKGTTITFNFYALTSQDLTVPYYLALLVQLIGPEGLEDETRETNCSLQSDVTLNGAPSALANFVYTIENIEGEYSSLRLHSSEDIVGIRDDETLLNPVFTSQVIANGELKDYSKVKPVPPTFSFESVDQANCPKDSKFKIISKLNPEKTIAVKLIFPLTYPEGISLIYNFESDELLCFGVKEVNDIIIMEQKIISKGAKKLFFLNNFSSDLQCENRLLEPAKNKIEVDVSFRQISHIKK